MFADLSPVGDSSDALLKPNSIFISHRLTLGFTAQPIVGESMSFKQKGNTNTLAEYICNGLHYLASKLLLFSYFCPFFSAHVAPLLISCRLSDLFLRRRRDGSD
jgi:hypothetical protein